MCRSARSYLRLPPSGGDAPPRIVHAGAINGDGTIDLAGFRAVDVAIHHPDGSPAAVCDVAIVMKSEGYSQRWHDRCVADADGRLRVLATEGNWVLVATDGRAFGASDLMPADGQPIDVVLQPMAIAQLRVVDAGGAPVAGARVALDCWPRTPRRGGDDVDAFARAACARHLLLLARSGVNGGLELPLPAGQVSAVELVRGDLRSEALELVTYGAERSVVLK